MRAGRTTGAALGLLCLAASASAWQGERAQKPTPAPQAAAQAPARAGREARAAAPDFAEALIGPEVALEGAKGEKLGTLEDHVLERSGGRVRLLVVEPAGGGRGKGKLVPWADLVWAQDRRAPRLELSKDELAALPDFDPARLQGLGADLVAGEAAKASESGGVEAGAGSTKGEAREADAPRSELRNVLTSELVGAKVSGQTQPFGVVQALVLEPGAGRVAFVLVDTGSAREQTGTRGSVLVPWQAMVISDRKQLVVPMSVEALAEAPRIERTAVSGLRRGTQQLEEVYRFYKIPTPVHSEGKGTMDQG